MVEPTLKEFMEKAQTESSLSNNDLDIKLIKELLIELKSNAYHGMFDEDVVEHITKVLEILDLIKTPNVDTDRLRTKVFPLSLAGDAKQWWIDEWDGKITAWGILVGRFFCMVRDERINRMTKGALCHSWIYRWENNESTDDFISSDDEWEEYDYRNPPNTTTDSFFKPYLKTQEK
ncbi:hypothetical protein Tco_1103760 [Tanacetum coccineum]